MAVVHGAVRKLRGGGRRRPRQGAGGCAQAHAHGNAGEASGRSGSQQFPKGAGHQPQGRRCGRGRGRRHYSIGRRGRGRHRLGERSGDHRQIRARHPRIRRRPLGRDRRHPSAVRLDQGAHHGGAGFDLHRPHDQAGRGRRAPEDAERDRARHPAGRPDHHLRVRDGDDSELRGLCRRRHLGGGPGGAVRHVDSDHDRRAAVGDRHRGHGSTGALQRAGDVGPRGRSRRRRRHAAARQDRHHHPRQPAGDRVQAGARRNRTGARRRRAARFAGRRNPRGTFHRRASQGEIRHPRPRSRRAARPFHSVHRAEPHERGRGRRLLGSQGRGRSDPGLPPHAGVEA